MTHRFRIESAALMLNAAKAYEVYKPKLEGVADLRLDRDEDSFEPHMAIDIDSIEQLLDVSIAVGKSLVLDRDSNGCYSIWINDGYME